MRRFRRLSSQLVVWSLLLPLAGCAASGGIHVDTPQAESSKPRKEQNWSRVARIRAASDITVTRAGDQPVSRTFVAADESELVTLDFTDATLPRPVRRTLRSLASDHPLELFKVAHGRSLTDGRVRFESGGIFLDDRRVAELDRVLDRAPRVSVTEIRRTHRATQRGLAWGLLIGGALGVGLTFAQCGTDWSQETRSCTNLTPLLVFVGPAYGGMIGGVLGATVKTSTTVYRR